MNPSTLLHRATHYISNILGLTPEEFTIQHLFKDKKSSHTVIIDDTLFTFKTEGSRLVNLYVKEGDEGTDSPYILIKFLDFRD
jgi:hypothetical protein